MKISVFNFNNFINFLNKNNVIVTIVSYSIATYMVRLIDSLFNNIVFNEDKTIFRKSRFFNIELIVNNNRFKVGRFLYSVCKFILCVILVFIISLIFADIID